MAKTSKTKQNIEILTNPLENPARREKALDNLATLGNPEAIRAIGRRAQDPLELPRIRNRALGCLARKRS
ncbi:MAG: hypothetical protein U9M91_04880 [Chloroflexota bacterium]|nr:hypothetical protein [Chloroflexota bacterium]